MKAWTSVSEDGSAVVEIEGEVDAHTARDLGKVLGDLLAQGHGRLALDFTRVSYISSAGLQVLLSAQQNAAKLSGGVRLFGPTAGVLKVFEISGFNRVLRIASSRQEATEN